MPHHVGADEVGAMACPSREAREAQGRLFGKTKVVNKARDERELAAELARHARTRDAPLNNVALRALKASSRCRPRRARSRP